MKQWNSETLKQWNDGTVESGYELRDAPPLEFYLNDPDRTKPENLKTDIYVPVKTL